MFLRLLTRDELVTQIQRSIFSAITFMHLLLYSPHLNWLA